MKKIINNIFKAKPNKSLKEKIEKLDSSESFKTNVKKMYDILYEYDARKN